MNDSSFPSRIDFGCCALGEEVSRTVSLQCKVPVEFEFEVVEVTNNAAFKVRRGGRRARVGCRVAAHDGASWQCRERAWHLSRAASPDLLSVVAEPTQPHSATLRP